MMKLLLYNMSFYILIPPPPSFGIIYSTVWNLRQFKLCQRAWQQEETPSHCDLEP